MDRRKAEQAGLVVALAERDQQAVNARQAASIQGRIGFARERHGCKSLGETVAPLKQSRFYYDTMNVGSFAILRNLGGAGRGSGKPPVKTGME